MKNILIFLIFVFCLTSCSKNDAPLNSKVEMRENSEQTNLTNAESSFPTPEKMTPIQPILFKMI